MKEKVAGFMIKGMQRDLSVSKFNPEFAYENMNLRLTAREDSTLLSLTNEKGNLPVVITNMIGGGTLTIQGTFLGYNVLEDLITIFTTSSGVDRIYRLVYSPVTKGFTGMLLFEGSLGFSPTFPIETLGVYENEMIQKVYWTDGINQPRVINVSLSVDQTKFDNHSFDFAQTLALRESVEIHRSEISGGVFAPGTLQYAFSYYNKYGAESAIFYSSPLQYTSYNNRGADPESGVSNSFEITITSPDQSFDYLRIYSIHRTSQDATPTVKRVVDLSVSSSLLHYTDSGTSGSIVDPTELLYKGSEPIVAQTMAQKDNTLFLGNFKLTRPVIPQIVRDLLTQEEVTFTNSPKGFYSEEVKGYYPYHNQLRYNSQTIKSFKYMEWYRLGVQFQHTSGKWSEVLWVKDVQNRVPVSQYPYSMSAYNLPQAFLNISDPLVINTLVSMGYIKARGVVCYPQVTDREVVAQGILCPTLYNVSDRYANAPFAISSWFVRPNAPYDFQRAATGISGGKDWRDRTNPANVSSSSPWGFFDEDTQTITGTGGIQVSIDSVSYGSLSEFRHNFPIPDNSHRNAEVQCITSPPLDPYTTETSLGGLSAYVGANAEYFYVDQSILTFHSPEIEFDTAIRSMDSSNLKLRIVGMVPITSSASDIDIIATTPPQQPWRIGFYKEMIGSQNLSILGAKGFNSEVCWMDYLHGSSQPDRMYGFATYPWHRNGSLNNCGVLTGTEIRPAMLGKKKLSNIKYSYETFYYNPDQIWNSYLPNNGTYTGISGVSIFDSNELSLTKIPAPRYSSLSDLSYYGNVDKVVNASRVGAKKNGYPIVIAGSVIQGDDDSSSTLFRNPYEILSSSLSNTPLGTEPCSIKYKSTPHAVLALNYTFGGQQRILPTICSGFDPLQAINPIAPPTGKHPFWDHTVSFISQDVLLPATWNPMDLQTDYGYLWLAELYNDNVSNRFGGQTEEAFENNLWLPAGEPTFLVAQDGLTPLESTQVAYTEGDTFFQRYDCLKTYPFTQEDQNSVVDIVSFMCETRINLDGRYDRNRGQVSNLSVTPQNFNLINKGYTQANNFFNYRAINHNKLQLDHFPNTLTWTKSKTLGELTDTWTNITLASTMDMDGDKGPINAIRRYNNELFCFQDKSVGRILFNSRVQIPTSEGVPIEISNNYKVDGKIYLSQNMGCQNKWSIITTSSGLYFIDNLSTSLYHFNGEAFESLTDKLGFRTFIDQTSSLKSWDGQDFDNFVGYYDPSNNDLYFINKDYALCYSELLGQFISFYSYERTPLFFSAGSDLYTLKNGQIWQQGAGDYNRFFGEIKPFYTTIIVNQEEPLDKTFSTLQFRSDTWDGAILKDRVTFDKLKVWTEYQSSEVTLVNKPDGTSPLKKKFRIWRAQIPRDSLNSRDRIRNPWMSLKLSMTDPKTYRTELHDLLVTYFT